MRKIRLHGDNIVECERIANLIIKFIQGAKVERSFSSLACPKVLVRGDIDGKEEQIEFTFFPGFNKSHNDRWKNNILELLKNQGCFLDETPDIIMTELEGEQETVLVAIEFCSALQAGNQAWQRSGRAYSVGRAKCPYIYLLDFVKYELDSSTRKRKELRFPNPAVVYSYIAHSLHTGNFVTQAYIQAEEFQPEFDKKLKSFDKAIFGEKTTAEYLIAKILHKSTDKLEAALLNKTSKMVKFLASDKENAFSSSDWDTIYKTDLDVVDFSKQKKLKYKKKVAKKSVYGKAKEFIDICAKYCIGIGSSDLPFGLLTAEKKNDFAQEIINLYNITDDAIIKKLQANEDLIVCTIKGFKPKGDDARPDRGALPFMAMLLNENMAVLTFVFGPMIKSNAKKLQEKPMALFKENGLWKSIIGISDLIFVNAPYVNSTDGLQYFYDNTTNKANILANTTTSSLGKVDVEPNRFQENDVDAIIHHIFKYLSIENSFEGMCNPPGGDWSGLSITDKQYEYRWLSLPRVSFEGKRPDHVIQLFDIYDKPVILTIESKEKGFDLENEVGVHLKNYLSNLFSFVPSVIKEKDSDWKIAQEKCNFDNYYIVSIGAFLQDDRIDKTSLFERTKCDMFFELKPISSSSKWLLTITCSPQFDFIKNHIKNILKSVSSCIEFNENTINRE